MLGEADYHSFNICYRLKMYWRKAEGYRGICEVDEKDICCPLQTV